MSKTIFRIVCLGIILALCLPMVACDFKFGGLVGELLANRNSNPGESEVMDIDSSFVDDVIENIDPVVPIDPEPIPGTEVTTKVEDETVSWDQTYDQTTEHFTEDTYPIDPGVPAVLIHHSFDELNALIGEEFEPIFTPGQMASWNQIADIQDYHVEYLRAWGWAAFISDTVGTFGYAIDDGERIYDQSFTVEAEQPVLDAAASTGAGSASRMDIRIPVRELSGEHFVTLWVKDSVTGTEEPMVSFELIKAVDPDAPVFSFWPADMMPSLVDQVGRYDIDSVGFGGNGEYITITTGTAGDPWYQLPMVNGKGYVASYVAIKYRTTGNTTTGNIYVGSGAGPMGEGDEIKYEIINDGKWHVALFDLSKSSAVQDGVINYLRWDMFIGGQNNVIDVSYIAAFRSIKAAKSYDAKYADIYYDAYVVPQADWVISGHSSALVDHSSAGLFPMIQAAGIASGALLHQGAVFAGDVDLSKYSKVYVYYGIDNSQVTQDHYNANPSNRIMLTSTDTHMRNSPEEQEIVASAIYTLNGWAVQRFEIDLTGIDYQGPVYVSYDTLPGTFMVIGAIEFVE